MPNPNPHNPHADQSPATPSRRDLLRSASAAAIGAGLGAHILTRSASASTPAQQGAQDSAQIRTYPTNARTREARIAHLTDFHVQPERRAGEGMAAALTHASRLDSTPTFLMTGGDLVMDSYGASQERTKTQWDLFQRTLQEHWDLPVRHCMGNHDIWGWDKTSSKTKGDEPLWGKKWFCDNFGLERPHYAFSQGSWRIIVLDSVQPREEKDYQGGLSDEQFEWLKGELASHKEAPTLLVSHIPIINISTVLADTKPDDKGWKIDPGLMFLDALRMVALLEQAPQVKAAISGHIHTVEDVTFQGVRYINNGAVSGNWWKSQEPQRDERKAKGLSVGTVAPLRALPGYGILDLYSDETLEWRYQTYGWKGE